MTTILSRIDHRLRSIRSPYCNTITSQPVDRFTIFVKCRTANLGTRSINCIERNSNLTCNRQVRGNISVRIFGASNHCCCSHQHHNIFFHCSAFFCFTLYYHSASSPSVQSSVYSPLSSSKSPSTRPDTLNPRSTMADTTFILGTAYGSNSSSHFLILNCLLPN